MPPKPLPNNLRRLWPLGIYRVVGSSMLPTYRSGDTLIGWRWFRPRPGHIVVVLHDGRLLIKRLSWIKPDGQLWLVGDNAGASTDSRQFGAVPRHHLIARIVTRIG